MLVSHARLTTLLRHVFASPAASNATCTAASVQPVTPTSSPSSTSAEEIMGVEVEAEGEHDVCKSLVVQFRRCKGYLPPCSASAFFQQLAFCSPCQHQPSVHISSIRSEGARLYLM